MGMSFSFPITDLGKDEYLCGTSMQRRDSAACSIMTAACGSLQSAARIRTGSPNSADCRYFILSPYLNWAFYVACVLWLPLREWRFGKGAWVCGAQSLSTDMLVDCEG